MFCQVPHPLIFTLKIYEMKKGEQRQQFQFFYKKITKALPSLYVYNLVIGISNEDYLARGERYSYAKGQCC